MNPLSWPLWAKITATAILGLGLAGGVTYAVTSGPGSFPAASPGIPRQPAAPLSTPSPAAPSGLSAGCQMGEDDGSGFTAVSQQNVSGDEPAYQVTIGNNTARAVTLVGFAVTFSAYGSQVWTDSPTVNNSVLVEPGETWTFPTTLGTSSFPQVSNATYLEMTCTVTSAVTPSGTITPSSAISEPDGNQVGHTQSVQQAQGQGQDDLNQLGSDTTSLNTDNSLASAVSQMKQDYQTEQAEYQTEKSDGCPAASGDAGAVSGDASAVGGDLSALNGAVTYLQQNEVAAVTGDLTAVQNDLGLLASLDAQPAVSTSAAQSAGKQALASAASAISWAQGQGNTINGEAQALSTTAANYASNEGCGI